MWDQSGTVPEARVVGSTTSWLDVALQQVQQGDSIAEPVAQASIVVLLPLYLAAHGINDLVKQDGAIRLEDLPLEAAAEDEHSCHRSALMEAQIICTHHSHCSAVMDKSLVGRLAHTHRHRSALMEVQVICTDLGQVLSHLHRCWSLLSKNACMISWQACMCNIAGSSFAWCAL